MAKGRGKKVRAFVTGLPGTVRQNKGKVGAGAGAGALIAGLVAWGLRRRSTRRSG